MLYEVITYWGDKDGAYVSELPKKWLKKDVGMIITDLSPIKLPSAQLVEFTMVASVSHFSPETKIYYDNLVEKVGDVELVSVGSSLKMCATAEGSAHLYPRLGPTMEWDTAAGQAVLEAAGGQLLDWSTKERMRYNRKQLLNGWFLCTAKNVNADEYWLVEQDDE